MRFRVRDGSIEPSPNPRPFRGESSFPVGAQIAVGLGSTGLIVALVVAINVGIRCLRGIQERRRRTTTTNYVPFDDIAGNEDGILPNARLSTRALPGGLSQKSSATPSTRVSAASMDSAIAAPEIGNHEHIGGSGVGFLDERGVPIVLGGNRESDATLSTTSDYDERGGRPTIYTDVADDYR